jgi:hypothetical protein
LKKRPTIGDVHLRICPPQVDRNQVNLCDIDIRILPISFRELHLNEICASTAFTWNLTCGTGRTVVAVLKEWNGEVHILESSGGRTNEKAGVLNKLELTSAD